MVMQCLVILWFGYFLFTYFSVLVGVQKKAPRVTEERVCQGPLISS